MENPDSRLTSGMHTLRHHERVSESPLAFIDLHKHVHVCSLHSSETNSKKAHQTISWMIEECKTKLNLFEVPGAQCKGTVLATPGQNSPGPHTLATPGAYVGQW